MKANLNFYIEDTIYDQCKAYMCSKITFGCSRTPVSEEVQVHEAMISRHDQGSS